MGACASRLYLGMDFLDAIGRIARSGAIGGTNRVSKHANTWVRIVDGLPRQKKTCLHIGIYGVSSYGHPKCATAQNRTLWVTMRRINHRGASSCGLPMQLGANGCLDIQGTSSSGLPGLNKQKAVCRRAPRWACLCLNCLLLAGRCSSKCVSLAMHVLGRFI